MILRDLLKDLTYGELQGLAIGNLLPGEAESEVDPHQYQQVVSYINMGLTELYKRFFLRSVEIMLQQHAEISTYLLHSDYSLANTTSPIAESERYIIDTAVSPSIISKSRYRSIRRPTTAFRSRIQTIIPPLPSNTGLSMFL
jgi:hypothetical protein